MSLSTDIQRLNQRLASAQPSATYRIMDRVAAHRWPTAEYQVEYTGRENVRRQFDHAQRG